MLDESIGGPALPPAGMQWLMGYRCMQFRTEPRFVKDERTHDEAGNRLPTLEECLAGAEDYFAEWQRRHPKIGSHEVRDEDGELLATIGKRLTEETRPKVMLVTVDGRCADCFGQVNLRFVHRSDGVASVTQRHFCCENCGITGDVLNTEGHR